MKLSFLFMALMLLTTQPALRPIVEFPTEPQVTCSVLTDGQIDENVQRIQSGTPTTIFEGARGMAEVASRAGDNAQTREVGLRGLGCGLLKHAEALEQSGISQCAAINEDLSNAMDVLRLVDTQSATLDWLSSLQLQRTESVDARICPTPFTVSLQLKPLPMPLLPSDEHPKITFHDTILPGVGEKNAEGELVIITVGSEVVVILLNKDHPDWHERIPMDIPCPWKFSVKARTRFSTKGYLVVRRLNKTVPCGQEFKLVSTRTSPNTVHIKPVAAGGS